MHCHFVNVFLMFYPLNTWQNSIHHYYCGTNSKKWASAVWVKIWKCDRMTERKPAAVHSLREKSTFKCLLSQLFVFLWKSSFWRCKSKVFTLLRAYIAVLVTRGTKTGTSLFRFQTSLYWWCLMNLISLCVLY